MNLYKTSTVAEIAVALREEGFLPPTGATVCDDYVAPDPARILAYRQTLGGRGWTLRDAMIAVYGWGRGFDRAARQAAQAQE